MVVAAINLVRGGFENKAVSYILSHFSPFGAFVCGHPSPDEVRMVQEESHSQRKRHEGQQSHASNVDIPGDNDCPHIDIHDPTLCGQVYSRSWREKTNEGLREKHIAQARGIGQEDGQRQQQTEEVVVVVGTDTVHQPNAVVVLTGDAGPAVTAMLAACGLDELTR